MATRRRRSSKAVEPTTETVVETPVAEEAVVEEQVAAPAVAPDVEEPVKVEDPEAAAPVDTTKLTKMLEDKRKDPSNTGVEQEGLKPMTEERLAEIRASAITPKSMENAGVEEIIKEAGVEKTRGREIAARLMYNARQRGGFV